MKSSGEVTSVSEEGLRAGDILFDMDGAGATHALIYLGSEKEEGSKLTVAHADFITFEKLLKTSLPAANYTVFRSNDPELGKLAAQVADNWATYNTPYDQKRLFAGQDVFNDRMDSANQNLDSVLQEHRKDFNVMDMIKYAGRANSAMCRPAEAGEDEESVRGARCAQFVLICYQTAVALKVNLVKPIVGDGQTLWNSNKHADPKQLDEYFTQNDPGKKNMKAFADFTRSKSAILLSYNEHRGKAQADTNDKDHPTYTPAIVAWNLGRGAPSETPIQEILPQGLVLGTTSCIPSVFRRALSLDDVGFKKPFDNALLSVPKKSYTQQESDLYKAQLNKAQQVSASKQADLRSYVNGETSELKSKPNLTFSK